MSVIVGTLTLEVGRKMNDYESNHRSGFDCCIGGMYDSSSAGTRRARHADVLRERHSKSVHRIHRVENQDGIPLLFLQLGTFLVLASLLSGCTSAGNPLPEERDELLVCQSHEAKICSGPGTASRIKNNSGSCYCAPVEQMQN
jgi:hypothetical protein